VIRRIYDGRIIRVEVEPVRLPNGVPVELELVRHPGAAAVVPVTESGVMLLRQYRYAGGGYLWEIPAGTLQPGEAPIECARRELLEEAGVVAGEFIHLGHILTTPGFCDERIDIFMARGLREGETHRDADEVIEEVRRVGWADLGRMIVSGEIVDAKSLVGIYHAARVVGVAFDATAAIEHSSDG
jgi:ADP-ribose pyrophosphatase